MPCFRTLMAHRNNGAPLCLWAFDLLALDGVRLMPLPHDQRKERVAELIAAADTEHIQFSGAFADPAKLLATCERMGLKDVVSKRRDSAYRPGATKDWARPRRPLGKPQTVIASSRCTSNKCASGHPFHGHRLWRRRPCWVLYNDVENLPTLTQISNLRSSAQYASEQRLLAVSCMRRQGQFIQFSDHGKFGARRHVIVYFTSSRGNKCLRQWHSWSR